MEKKRFWKFFSFTMAALLTSGLVACSKDDEKEKEDPIDTSLITLSAEGETTITGVNSVKSNNEFVAYTKGTTVYGYHVGETSLIINDKKERPVRVVPKYNLYDGPICNWGCSQSYIKEHQKQGTLSPKSTDTMLGYLNAGAASLLGYTFENGKLKSIMAAVSTNHTSSFASFLSERYMMLPVYEGKDTYFVGMDGLTLAESKTVVLLMVYNTEMLAAAYQPASTYTTRAYSDIKQVESPFTGTQLSGFFQKSNV